LRDISYLNAEYQHVAIDIREVKFHYETKGHVKVYSEAVCK